MTWKVGDTISFSGAATDEQDGTLPPAAPCLGLSTFEHCPSNCHSHPSELAPAGAGSFVAPDHEYPSYLELRLTATDSGGLSDTQTVRLDPAHRLRDACAPALPGSACRSGPTTAARPSRARSSKGAATTIAAAVARRRWAGNPFVFGSWSDGGAQAHNVTVNDDSDLHRHVQFSVGLILSGVERADRTYATGRLNCAGGGARSRMVCALGISGCMQRPPT